MLPITYTRDRVTINNKNNTAISNIVFRVANSKFNYITNCPIAFATTIECNLQQGFNSQLFIVTIAYLNALLVFHYYNLFEPYLIIII